MGINSEENRGISLLKVSFSFFFFFLLFSCSQCILFIWKASERERIKREWVREEQFSLYYFSNGCHSWHWAKQKPVARTSIQVSLGQRPKHMSHVRMLFLQAPQQELLWKQSSSHTSCQRQCWYCCSRQLNLLHHKTRAQTTVLRASVLVGRINSYNWDMYILGGNVKKPLNSNILLERS